MVVFKKGLKMANALGNIGSAVLGGLKGGAEALAAHSPGYNQFKQNQARDMAIETQKMERWIKIAKDPSFTRDLRINSLKQAFSTKAGKVLLGQTTIRPDDKWYGENIDRMDKQTVLPKDFLSRGGRTSTSFTDPVTGVTYRNYGNDTTNTYDPKIVDRIRELRNSLSETITEEEKKEIEAEIEFLKSRSGLPYFQNQGKPKKANWKSGLARLEDENFGKASQKAMKDFGDSFVDDLIDDGAEPEQAIQTFMSLWEKEYSKRGIFRDDVVPKPPKNFGNQMKLERATQETDYGQRADGTQKGTGFFGELQLPDGGVATEYSVGVQLKSKGGKETEIPSLVPTLT
ncbi:hypothetical protein LCGC14_1110370, partial [marine sediment metagenome]